MSEIKSLSFDNRVKKTNYMFQGVPFSTFNFSWRKEIWDIFNLFLPCKSNLGIMCTQNN